MNTLQAPSLDSFEELNLLPLQKASLQTVLSKSTPLLAGRLRMLATDTDRHWSQYLVWNLDKGLELLQILKNAHGFERPPTLLGYQYIDLETYYAIFAVGIVGPEERHIVFMRMALHVDQASHELGWKLDGFDLQMQWSGGQLLQSIEELQAAASKDMANRATTGQTGNDKVSPGEEAGDDYWAQYDQSDEEAGPTVSDLRASETEADHYKRYEEEVDEVIVNGKDKSGQSEASYPEVLPSIVLHVEHSLKSLRRLAHAANLTDAQFTLIVQKIMHEEP